MSFRTDLRVLSCTKVGRIYEHQHCWKYLSFFILGSRLPDSVKERFAELAVYDMRDHGSLEKFARQRSRSIPEDNQTKAEEFFKLALDCECTLMEGLNVRRQHLPECLSGSVNLRMAARTQRTHQMEQRLAGNAVMDHYIGAVADAARAYNIFRRKGVFTLPIKRGTGVFALVPRVCPALPADLRG